MCGNGFKLNYHQYPVVDAVSGGVMSDGVSDTYYAWIDSKGNFIHFAKNANTGAISCDLPFDLTQKGNTYKITDLTNNKLIFEASSDSAVYRLKTVKDNFNNAITLTYSGIYLTEISSASGDPVRFNYDENSDLMLNMVEVLDNDTQVITSFTTNGDPCLTDIIF